MSEDIDPGEVVIARVRPGWGGFLRDALQTGIFAFAALTLWRWWQTGAALSLVEAALWAIMFPALIFASNAFFWSADRWVLTNQRVIDARRARSLALSVMKPVGRSFWREASLFGRDCTRFWLRGIPNLNAFLAQIEAARQSASEKATHV